MSDDQVELRGLITRRVANVLDAVAHARGVSRMEIASMVLREYAEKKAHEANVINRVLKRNGSGADGEGGEA